MSDREVLEHLLDCFDSAYRVLGQIAPRLSDDAYAIRVYESARAMGEVALAFRELLDTVDARPVAAISEVINAAVREDASGAMVVFAMATLVGPRLLVSLRDARDEGLLDERGLAASAIASATLIREILAMGEVARGEDEIEDDQWQNAARSLGDRLDEGGHAESFGLSR